MIYVKFWDQVHEMPADEASERLPKIKHEEDLRIINEFNNLYKTFRETRHHEENTAYSNRDNFDDRKDSEGSLDEVADDIEAMSKYLEKLSKANNVQPKAQKKLNPYKHAQSEYKKSRTISKRLNTLSIFVKKDTDNNRHLDAIFDGDDADTAKPSARFGGRK
jgi:hypothetical protein